MWWGTNMKKGCACFILALVICLAGCDGKEVRKEYPYYKSAKWYCEEIDFTISFDRDEKGKLTASPPADLTWDGQIYNVYVGFRGSSYHFLATGETEAAKIYLSGLWKYRGENVVFSVTEDLIFEGTFVELVFAPQ